MEAPGATGGGEDDGLLSKEGDRMSDKLKEFYDHQYHNVVHHAMMEDDDYFFARAQAFKEIYFSDFPADSRVLDYGCGLGQSVVLLADAWGYDPSAEARDLARQRGLKIFDTPDAIPQHSFDVVLCRHALEHMPNPTEVLETLRTYLKANGTLLLVLPQEGHSLTSFELDRNRHLFAWNFRCINNLLGVCGFRVTSNKVYYNLGFRKLLPLRPFIGHRLYVKATELVGRLYRNGELVVYAVPRDESVE